MRSKFMTTVGTLLAAAALAACGGDDNGGGSDGGGGLPDSARSDFIAGCTSSGVSEAGCECMFDELTGTQGLDTEEELQQLQEDVQAATQEPDPAAAMPTEFREAAQACQEEIQQSQ
jgi:hypothetical protein